MLAIIDYGMGNLRSVQKGFEKVGISAEITSDPDALDRADHIVLPGVGAVADAAAELKARGLDQAICQAIEKGKPFLGICLGFQLLFDRSEESDGCDTLGIIPGKVVLFRLPKELPVPHIGWNQLAFPQPSPLFKGIDEGAYVYFVHSYYAVPENRQYTAATSDYGITFCCSIAKDNVFGTQFHPEKSQSVGLTLLKNFGNL